MVLNKFRLNLKSILVYGALIAFSMPIFLVFLWLVITTFSTRTEGLKSLGWTLSNWSFLWKSPFGGNHLLALIFRVYGWRLSIHFFLPQ